MRWAEDLLPAGTHFVGGHPMAGREQSGPGGATETLFEGRPYCIVAGAQVTPGAVNAVENVAKAVGAEPFFMDAEEHDSYAAAISHTPLVASIALFNLARSSTAWPELASMAGPGFRDLTRLASGEPAMAHDICLTNRENILHWIDRYVDELVRLRGMVENSEPEALFRVLAETQMERDNFLEGPPKRDEEKKQVDLPTASEAFMDSMIGGYWRQRATEMADALEERARARSRAERLRRRD
jgi:prephenate dehydrogenase